MFKVEYDVQKPKQKGGGAPRKYPFDEMQVGGSFFAAAADTNFTNQAKLAVSIRACAGIYFGGPGYVSCQSVTENGVEGVRCWREK